MLKHINSVCVPQCCVWRNKNEEVTKYEICFLLINISKDTENTMEKKLILQGERKHTNVKQNNNMQPVSKMSAQTSRVNSSHQDTEKLQVNISLYSELNGFWV